MDVEKSSHVGMFGPLPQEDAQSYLDGFQGRNDLKVGPNMLAWALESTLARLAEAAAALAKLQAENSALVRERDQWKESDLAFRRSSVAASARAEKAEADLKEAREALRPFARFDIGGFKGPVLEVVNASPDNPAARIEPILLDHFRAASRALDPTHGRRE